MTARSGHGRSCHAIGAAALLACAVTVYAETTELGIRETRFTINGSPVFLMGMSYYGALGAPEEFIDRDLDDMQDSGFNWIRVWATWAAFEKDVSAVTRDGYPREPFVGRLKSLVEKCNLRGMIVDVTLSRGNGTTGPPRLQSLDAHRRAVEALVTALRPYRNWYLDLANERSVRDPRFVSFAELAQLRQVVRQMDAKRLVTASNGGDISRDHLREYVITVQVDFVAPHRPRNAASPGQTEAKTREYYQWMKDLGRVVPVHYQEPLRRGFNRPGAWEPSAESFAADLKGALAGGAAGWCFHQGDQRDRPDGKPRHSFDLTEQRLFEQFDAQEREAIRLFPRILGGDQASRPSSRPSR